MRMPEYLKESDHIFIRLEGLRLAHEKRLRRIALQTMIGYALLLLFFLLMIFAPLIKAYAAVGHICAWVQDINDPAYTPVTENNFTIVDTGQ